MKKINIQKAVEQYSVPYTTLNDKLNKWYKHKIDCQPVLTNSDEKKLTLSIIVLCKMGVPLGNKDVGDIVQERHTKESIYL